MKNRTEGQFKARYWWLYKKANKDVNFPDRDSILANYYHPGSSKNARHPN